MRNSHISQPSLDISKRENHLVVARLGSGPIAARLHRPLPPPCVSAPTCPSTSHDRMSELKFSGTHHTADNWSEESRLQKFSEAPKELFTDDTKLLTFPIQFANLAAPYPQLQDSHFSTTCLFQSVPCACRGSPRMLQGFKDSVHTDILQNYSGPKFPKWFIFAGVSQGLEFPVAICGSGPSVPQTCVRIPSGSDGWALQVPSPAGN